MSVAPARRCALRTPRAQASLQAAQASTRALAAQDPCLGRPARIDPKRCRNGTGGARPRIRRRGLADAPEHCPYAPRRGCSGRVRPAPPARPRRRGARLPRAWTRGQSRTGSPPCSLLGNTGTSTHPRDSTPGRIEAVCTVDDGAAGLRPPPSARQRRMDGAGAARARVRAVRAGRPTAGAPTRSSGAGTGDQPKRGPWDGRRPRGREHAGGWGVHSRSRCHAPYQDLRPSE